MPGDAALIVAGPTASGKSALAVGLAQRLGGTIINADSMQVYRELRVLTARPTAEDEASVPHRAVWRASRRRGWQRRVVARAALEAMEMARAAGRVPILCGGTGLYFAALIGGLAEIPDPGAVARDEARALLAELGPVGLHARLAAADPGRPRGCGPATASASPARGRSGVAPDAVWRVAGAAPDRRARWSVRCIAAGPAAEPCCGRP